MKLVLFQRDAFDQFNKFLYERDMDGYYLVVQQERELSNYIEEKTNVKHESPQAFYFVKGQAVWNADHENINVSSLANLKNNKLKISTSACSMFLIWKPITSAYFIF